MRHSTQKHINNHTEHNTQQYCQRILNVQNVKYIFNVCIQNIKINQNPTLRILQRHVQLPRINPMQMWFSNTAVL